MLPAKVRDAWDAATDEDRSAAMTLAYTTLGNLVHYRDRRVSPYKIDDATILAATFVFLLAHHVNEDTGEALAAYWKG